MHLVRKEIWPEDQGGWSVCNIWGIDNEHHETIVRHCLLQLNEGHVKMTRWRETRSHYFVISCFRWYQWK